MAPLNTSIATPFEFKTVSHFNSVQSKLYADRPLARYFINNRYDILTYAQMDRIATNLACKWVKIMNTSVISLIGDHNIDYFITLMALIKLRIPIMLISSRNSKAANINLLEKTQSKLILTNKKHESMAKACAENISGVDVLLIEAFDIKKLLENPLQDYTNLLDTEVSDKDLLKTAFIFHSSGSTSFPKPIYISNNYLLCSFSVFYTQLPGATLDDVFLPCIPLGHIFGFCAAFSTTLIGASLVFMEKLPASQEEINFALSYNKCTTLASAPIMYDEMIPYLEKKKDFTTIQKLRLCIAGGAAIKPESEIWFRQHGLAVLNSYGSTECGPGMISGLNSNKNRTSMYPFVVDSEGNPYIDFETEDPATPDIKHCYLRGGCPIIATGVSNRSDGGYNTNDLFKLDPDAPGFYIYLGRRDDILIMKNGEKTNPIPMENTLLKSEVISKVVVVGQARECTAILVELDYEYASNHSTEEIHLKIQHAIDNANKDCPNHSKIFHQMVKILPMDEHLPTTPKGSVMRKKAYVDFEKYIDQLYNDFLQGPVKSNKMIEKDAVWDSKRIQDFIIESIINVIGNDKIDFITEKDKSLFDLGLDSITAIQLRNKIAASFDDVPKNFIFQNQSFFEICQTLLGNHNADKDRLQQTQDLAEFYIKKARIDFPVATITQEKRPNVVLLTGVTGSLGSFILQDLLKKENVEKVYCLIRGDNLKDRLHHAFESRSLDVSLLKTNRIEILPMLLNDPLLGLTPEKYNQLRDEVTIVQHCGWLLDFNMPIDYFDKECIAPFYNLLKFAYRKVNPMKIHFISSISASALWGASIPEEPLPFDAGICMPMGYGQSKFVVEVLFNYLSTEKKFPCYIERLGQVCGDSIQGVWNISEQFPKLFIGGASVMHKMPDLNTVIDWIPVDYASASIAEIMLSYTDNYIHHIVNPHIIYWTDVLKIMENAGMTFDVISLEDWVQELAQDASNPCYGLLNYFEDKSRNMVNMPIWETKKTIDLVPILNKAPVLDVDLFKKFLTHWKSIGYYHPNN